MTRYEWLSIGIREGAWPRVTPPPRARVITVEREERIERTKAWIAQTPNRSCFNANAR